MQRASKIKAIAASLLLVTTPACAYSSLQTPPNPAVQTNVTAAAATLAETVHQITFTSAQSADLAKKYPFIQQAMEPRESPDGTPFIEPPPVFPDTVKIAEITLPEKGLNFVALLVEGDDWCSAEGLCNLSFHFLRENGDYEQLAAMWNAEPSSYYITTPRSFSVVFCENGDFHRWTLKDGALKEPMPMDQSGYFGYDGVYKNPAMTNACPPAPKL